MSEQEEWLTVPQAAELLGVARRTLHQYVRQGKLPAYKSKIGGRTLFRRAELEAFKKPERIRRPGESKESRRAA